MRLKFTRLEVQGSGIEDQGLQFGVLALRISE